MVSAVTAKKNAASNGSSVVTSHDYGWDSVVNTSHLLLFTVTAYRVIILQHKDKLSLCLINEMKFRIDFWRG
jgi:hypothetical protein